MPEEMQGMDDRKRGDLDARDWRATIAFTGFAGIALFFLISEHRAHLVGLLPWALLLALPFLHMFMHGGHGTHRGHTDEYPAAQHERGDSPPSAHDRSAHRH